MTELDGRNGTSRAVQARRRIGSSFSLVTAGTASGQLFMAMAIPLISHAYVAAEVGKFALALSLAQLGAIAVSGRIEQVLPRLDHDQRWQALVVSTLPMVVLLPSAGSLLVLSGAVSLSVAVTVGILTASIALYNITSLCVLASQRYKLIASMRLINGLLTAILQVSGAWVDASAAMLICTYAVGNLVAAVMTLGVLMQIRQLRSSESLRSVFRREHLGAFAFSVGGSALMSSFSLALPVIIFAHAYGVALVGSFYLARKFLMVPTQLVAMTVSEVSYSMIARQAPAEIRVLVRRWLRKLLVASVGLLIIGVIGAPVAELLIGPGYQYMWQVVLMLTAAAAVQLVATALSNVLLALHAEKIRFTWNVFRLIALSAVLGVCAVVQAPYLAAVAAMTVVLTGSYLVLLRLTLRTLDRRVLDR